MAGFTKKELIEAIQDTIQDEMNSGQINANRITDLQSMIKGAIRSNMADDEMKGMADNIGDLRDLFAKVSEDMSRQPRQPNSGPNRPQPNSNTPEQSNRNSGEHETVTRIGGVINMMTTNVGKFFGGPVGGTLYDALNMITDGQLGVVRSMAGTVGRMSESVGYLYSGIKDQIDTVFVDEKKNLIDPAINAVKGVDAALGVGVFASNEKKSLNLAEESRDILEDILRAQTGTEETLEEQFKWNLRQRSSDLGKTLKKLFFDILIFISGSVGFIIGGIVGQISSRFQALYLTIKTIFKPFLVLKDIIFPLLIKPIKELGKSFMFLAEILTGNTSIGAKIKDFFDIFRKIPNLKGGFLKNISILAKYFGDISKLKGITDLGGAGTGIAKIVTRISNIVLGVTTWARKLLISFRLFLRSASTMAKIFGGFFRFFKVGMRILGWPLTILMGIIDFVKGFMNTEGGIAQKVMGGLKAAIMGIIEMPLRVIGWVFDKLTGSEGSGEKIVKFVSGWIDAFFGGILAILTSLWGSVKSLGKRIMDVVDGIIDIFKNIWNFFVSLKNFDLEKMGDALSGIWDGIKRIASGIMGGLFDLATSIPRMFTAYLESLWPKIEELARGTIFEPFVWFFGQIGSIVKSIVDEIMGIVKSIPFIGDSVKSDVEKRTESIKKTAALRGRITDIESGKETFSDSWFGGKTGAEKKVEAITKLRAEISEQEKETAKYSPPSEPIKSPDVMSKGQRDGILGGLDQIGGEIKTLMGPTSGVKRSDTTPITEQIMKETKTLMGPTSGTKTSIGGNTQYDAQINAAAQKYGVSPDLVKSVIKTESNFNPNAKSPVGAGGLMQMMPGTAKDLGVQDRFNPEQNIEGGTKYLAQLSKKYGGDMDKTLAAYNWGPGNVDRKGLSNMPLETQNYLKRVKGGMPVEITKTDAPTGLGNAVNTAEIAKQNIIKKQMDQTNGLSDSISQMSKNTNQKSAAPVIVNSDSGGGRTQEPPTDVESMSILWLNKSWGLG